MNRAFSYIGESNQEFSMSLAVAGASLRLVPMGDNLKRQCSYIRLEDNSHQKPRIFAASFGGFLFFALVAHR
jgi:hypothetical protein